MRGEVLKILEKTFSLKRLKKYLLLLLFSLFISFILYVREFISSFIDDFFIKVENQFFYLPEDKTKDIVFVYLDESTFFNWNAKLKPLIPSVSKIRLLL